MQWSYACPHCGASLNPADTVVLTATHGDAAMLVGLHPQPGDYTIYLPPDAQVDAGDRWDFFCPVCQESLTTRDNPDLCAIDLWEGGDRLRVLFSRVAGEHATFVVHEEGVRASHGEHATRYDVASMQMKYLL